MHPGILQYQQSLCATRAILKYYRRFRLDLAKSGQEVVRFGGFPGLETVNLAYFYLKALENLSVCVNKTQVSKVSQKLVFPLATCSQNWHGIHVYVWHARGCQSCYHSMTGLVSHITENYHESAGSELMCLTRYRFSCVVWLQSDHETYFIASSKGAPVGCLNQ